MSQHYGFVLFHHEDSNGFTNALKMQNHILEGNLVRGFRFEIFVIGFLLIFYYYFSWKSHQVMKELQEIGNGTRLRRKTLFLIPKELILILMRSSIEDTSH